MKHWIRVNDRSKSEIFRCPECGQTCFCRHYEVKDCKLYNVCNYIFCPFCGKQILEKEEENNDR